MAIRTSTAQADAYFSGSSRVGVCQSARPRGYFSKRHDTHRRVVRVTDPSSAKDDGRDSGPRTTQRERSSSACEPTLGAVEGFTNMVVSYP